MTRLAYGSVILFGIAAAGLGGYGVAGGAGTLRLTWLVPLGGIELTLDPLGGLFLALIGLAVVPASVYALGYPDGDTGRFAYFVFVASMCVVPLAANTMTFLIAWELMSLASYFLVLRDRESRESIRAAWVYAVMTHAGLACLLAGMLLLGADVGSPRFADWRAAASALAPTTRDAAFVLLALGFAGKAGVIPLHVWLPLAHPAAPSHVSALMSGVMIKLGIYGLLRVSLDWLGVGPPWWGAALLIAGAASSVIGVLYALVEHDLKRLLAFHSIENIGIILLGIGSAALYRVAGLDALALLGLIAALYHTVNHAAFKALLFLGAGAVVHATGTRNMEAMGGLIKRMPWTAACFLIGSAAIAALPPLNGFVSEWLTFLALFQNMRLESVGQNLVFTLGIASLALTGGLAMACFVKAFGITFLALPRSDAAAGAHEASPPMRLAMLALAAACVALGLGPTLVVPVFGAVACRASLRASPRRRSPSSLPRRSSSPSRPSGSWARRAGHAVTRRGAAAVSCRPRGWSTRRPRSPTRSSASSTSSIGPRSASTSSSTRSRASSSNGSNTRTRRARSSTTGSTGPRSTSSTPGRAPSERCSRAARTNIWPTSWSPSC